MDKANKAAVPVVGAIFLILALVKFLQGDGWVVWAIIGVLFGGLGMFRRNRLDGGRS